MRWKGGTNESFQVQFSVESSTQTQFLPISKDSILPQFFSTVRALCHLGGLQQLIGVLLTIIIPRIDQLFHSEHALILYYLYNKMRVK